MISADAPDACTYCDPNKRVLGITLLMLISLLMATLIIVYIMFVRGSEMKRWVSTANLFISHLQTLAVFGNLQLNWPPSIGTATDLLSLSLAHASFLRPECFMNSSKSFLILSLAQVTAVLAALLVTTLLYALPSRVTWVGAGLRGRAFLVQTIIVSCTFSSTWRLALNLFLYGSVYTLHDMPAGIGALLALNAALMLGTQLALVGRYVLDVFALLAHRTATLEGGGLVTVSSASLLHRIAHSRLGRLATRWVALDGDAAC